MPVKGSNNLGDDTPRTPAFRLNDTTRAIASKLVEGLYGKRNTRGEKDKKAITPPTAMVANMANKIAGNTVDAENMIQLLPDMELAKQVLVSSILSPVDMVSTEVTYSSDADALGDVKGKMLEVVKNYFENDYKIMPRLSVILEEMLFTKGAYIWLILPESSIDHAINSNSRVSMESIANLVDRQGRAKHLGLLGNAGVRTSPAHFNGLGLESVYDTRITYDPVVRHPGLGNIGQYTSVTDNNQVLKLPKLYDKMTHDRVQDALSVNQISLEAHLDKRAHPDENQSLYKPRQFDYQAVLRIKTLAELDRETIGHPLVINAPVESCIPVHAPASPSEHIGYFFIVDAQGNFIRSSTTQDYYADFAYNAANMRDMGSQLLANGRRGQEGRKDLTDVMMFEEASRCYAEIIEEDLYQRLKNGLFGDNVKIARPEEIYRMMFARACSYMQTQLVYVPASLVQYAAFDYNDFGIGKSLTESTKILGSIRAILLFANTMASIKNSINHTKMTLKFDPDDPDPDYTMEQAMNDTAKARFATFPLGAANPNDMVTYLNNAGFLIESEGHPNYPDTKVEMSNYNAGVTQVSTELSDDLKKRHMMAYNVAPETVELSMGADFATSVVNSNILLAKRSMRYQEKFTPNLDGFIQKFISNSKTLMDKLRDILIEHKAVLGLDQTKLKPDRIVMYFINSIKVSLPKPDLKRLETQMAAFDNYSQSLDKALPAFITTEMFDSTVVGNLSNAVGTTIAVLKAYYQRRWLEENGIMTELFDLITSTDNKDGAFDLLKSHQKYVEGLGASILGFMQEAGKFVYKSDKILTDIQNTYNTTGGDSGGGDNGGGAYGGDEEGGGEGGDTEEENNGDFNPDAAGGEEEGGGAEGEAEEGGEEDNGDFKAPEEAEEPEKEKEEKPEAENEGKKEKPEKEEENNGDFKAPE